MSLVLHHPDGPALRDALRSALAVERWVDEVARHAPFLTAEQLLAAADVAAVGLTGAEIDEALSRHPRIGERPRGQDLDARFSRAEQGSPDADDTRLQAVIAAGNARYEERFGRIFVVRAKGRSRAEIAQILDARLGNDDITELAVVARELAEIALLRVRVLTEDDMTDGTAPAESGDAVPEKTGDSGRYAGKSAITTHVLDIHRGKTAVGMHITLEGFVRGAWHHLDEGLTNEDGRIDVIGPLALEPGHYRLTFDTAEYFEREEQEYFFPVVVVAFDASDPTRHYHVPIMLSPFGYSTYRGS